MFNGTMLPQQLTVSSLVEQCLEAPPWPIGLLDWAQSSVSCTNIKAEYFTYSMRTLFSEKLKWLRQSLKFSGEQNRNSLAFWLFIEGAVALVWIRPYDVLVCNNAAIHKKGYNVDLEDYLWNSPGLDGEPLHILLLPLPTQSTKLDPTKLIWNRLIMIILAVQRRDG